MGEEGASKLESARFQVLRELGAGGMGVVYEAYDHQTDAVVALKTLHRPDGEALYRLKQEFRALADVQHPNLVHLGELLCEGGQWFFTMERVAGRDFHAWVRLDGRSDIGQAATEETEVVTQRRPAEEVAAPEVAKPSAAARGYDEGRLRHAARQLAAAIHAIHRAGRVHRDIKPSNVVVRDDGHLVLLDFGLIEEVATGAACEGDRGLVVGTPSFMPPEQAENQHVGPEADWYAFGVMLFLALTGTLPFSGPADRVLEAKRRYPAPAPRDRLADVPEDLDALCRELLERDPRRRPDGAAVLQRLGVDPGEEAPTRARGGLDGSAPFFGRAAELTALEEALAGCRAGRAARVLLRGEAGVGKSALVRRFLERAAAGEAPPVILAGRAYEQESVPFKALDTVIDALSLHLRGLPDDELEPLLGGGVRFLASVFPVLTRVPALKRRLAGGRTVPNPTTLRAQAFAELKQLLAALAARVPLVLYVDDLQWADADSLALLDTLLLEEDGPTCLFVGTLRADSPAPPGLQRLVAAARTIELAGLTRDEARALLTALSGAAATPELETLLEEAGGHPLFLAELARRPHGGPHDGGVLHLKEALWRRYIALDEEARRFLELVALSAGPIALQVVARAAALEPEACLHLLGDLRAAQLIRIDRRGEERLVEPYHDRIREAIVEGLAPPERVQALHLALGRALIAIAPGEVFAAAYHLDAALPLITDPAERRQLAELHLAAARQARLATAYEMALSYVERGLHLATAPDPLRRGLEAERMEAEYLAGRREVALGHFAELVGAVESERERVDLYVTKIGLDTGHGYFLEAIETTREALARFSVKLPRKATVASLLLEYAAVRRAQKGRPIEALLELPALGDGDQRCVVELLMAVTPAAFFVSTELVTVCLMKIARLALQHGVTDVSAYGLAGYGAVLSGAFGRCHDADAFGRLALALNRRFGNDRLASKLYFICGTYLTAWARPFAEAQAELRAAADAARASGDTAYEAYAAATLTVLNYCESADLAAMRADAEASLLVTTRRRDLDMSAIVSAQLRYAAALRRRGGSPDLSLPSSSEEEFAAGLSDARTPIGIFYYYFLGAELAYLWDDVTRARRLLAEAHKRTNGIFSVPTTVDLLFLDALVAARACDTGGPLARARLKWTLARRCKKLDHFAAACPANFAAHARLARAEEARVRGDHAAAGVAYARAIEAARQHGQRKREALAHELAARHYAAQGRAEEAAIYRAEAAHAWQRFGAGPLGRG